MSSGAHGGGPIRTELFWSTDLQYLVRVHSGLTKQWLYLTVETGPRAPACGDLMVTQKTMRCRPQGCAVLAENRSKLLVELPRLLQDAGLRCWQTPVAARWSFAKTKERVRQDYELRRGRRRPASGPGRRRWPVTAPASNQLFLFAVYPNELASAPSTGASAEKSSLSFSVHNTPFLCHAPAAPLSAHLFLVSFSE